ncbi:uncharacterized protein LOC143933722 isoform X2 [Lithobates pipiens]
MSKNTPSAQRTATCSATMSEVTTACVFCTVLMIAHSLKCFHSFNTVPGTEGVEGVLLNCSSKQDACILIFYNIEKRSDKKLEGYLYSMRCAQKSECNMAESMTTAGFYISYNSTCCDIDKCVPRRPLSYNVYSYGCATKNIFKNNGEFVNSFSLLTRFVIKGISREHQLPVGNFLWCHECQDAKSSSCAKYQVLCQPDNDVCLTEMRRITEDPSRKLTMQTVKRCGNSDECNIDGTLTGRGITLTIKTLTIKTSCCETDMCNAPDGSWSLKRKKPNGKMCPIYSSLHKDYPELDVVQCTGDETRCVNFTSLITEGSISREELLHGCAMESICENKLIKEYRSTSNKMLVKNDIICSNGMTIMFFLHHLIIFCIAALAVLRD